MLHELVLNEAQVSLIIFTLGEAIALSERQNEDLDRYH